MVRKKTNASHAKNSQPSQELAQIRSRLARALADYQNLENHIQTEISQELFRVKKQMVEDILDVYESLTKLSDHSQDSNIKVVQKQLEVVLGRWGVEKLKVKIGDHFDPNFSQCLKVIEGKADNIIVNIIRPGYKMAGQLIRPALVNVSKKLSQKEAKND